MYSFLFFIKLIHAQKGGVPPTDGSGDVSRITFCSVLASKGKWFNYILNLSELWSYIVAF